MTAARGFIDFGKLTGDKELHAALMALPAKVQRAVIQRAARPALNAIKADAQRNVRAIVVASGKAAGQGRDASGRFLTVKQRDEQGGGSLRDDIARAMKVATIRPRGNRKSYGARLRVQYPKRKGNDLDGPLRVALSHLLEWGFRHKASGKAIPGHGFMTKAFLANRAKAEGMIRAAVAALVRNPGLSRADLRKAVR